MSERTPSLAAVFTEQCRSALSHMLSAKAEEEEAQRRDRQASKVIGHVDDHIAFSHLTKTSDPSSTDDMFDLSMSMAVSGGKKEGVDLSTSKLSKVNFLILMDINEFTRVIFGFLFYMFQHYQCLQAVGLRTVNLNHMYNARYARK